MKLARGLALASVALTFGLIVVGAIVRVSGSGEGCPDWPLCHGQFIPPFEYHTLVEYSHRLVTLLVSVAVFSLALVALARFRHVRWIVVPAVLAVLLLVLQAALGALVVILHLPPTAVTIHLGNALLLFATLITAAAFLLRFGSTSPARPDATGSSGLLARAALVGAAEIYFLVLSGSYVVGSGAGPACSSWPLCDGWLPVGSLQWIHMAHRLIAAGIGLHLILTVRRARQAGGLLSQVAGTAALLFVVQGIVGAMNALLVIPPALAALHLALAAAIWGLWVLFTLLACIEAGLIRVQNTQVAAPPAVQPLPPAPVSPVAPRGIAAGNWRDYLALTKPWIVVLLLTTTFGAMLIAARGFPPLPLLFWTLLGGACSAAGANALNSYIDRETDKVMARTSRRPLPAGRVTPGPALFFALSLCLLSQVILLTFVNLLAAGLSLVGIIYYAWIYTVLLKRATPQNIVVGGVAGAIPPLVGWAAVTNDLSLLSLYLFTIILLWTPPHTWALMLLIEKDYRRVQIPMLPAAWGQVEARRQILLYSIMLVAITLVPSAIGSLGLMYLLGAILLGAWFLGLAARLWWVGESKPLARRLYHFSNAYLALLFLLMVLDHWFVRG